MAILKEKSLGKRLAQILKPLDMIAPKVLPLREISSPNLIQLAKTLTSFYVLMFAYKPIVIVTKSNHLVPKNSLF